MNNQEKFANKIKEQAEKDGKKILSQKDAFKRIVDPIKRIYEKAETHASKERDEDIKNHNETLYLLYGIAVGILGSILIQSIFENLKIFIPKESHFFIFTLLIMLSTFFLVLIIIPLKKGLGKFKKSVVLNTKKINTARKVIRDANKAKNIIKSI